jgi:uncharacterized tellurite resistance protein B-like protein
MNDNIINEEETNKKIKILNSLSQCLMLKLVKYLDIHNEDKKKIEFLKIQNSIKKNIENEKRIEIIEQLIEQRMIDINDYYKLIMQFELL